MTSNFKYIKTYRTTKNDQETYFSIDYDLRIEEYPEHNQTSLKAYYTVKYSEDELLSDTWFISSDSRNCSLHDSIMINESYRSYGIGSFLLNEILKTVNIYTPNASLRASLAFNDQGEENAKRRDAMYKNFGFEVHPDHIYIDKISNLSLNRKFDFIKEINPFKDYNKLLRENRNYKESNANLSNSIRTYSNKLFDCSKQYKKLKRWLILILLGIALLIFILFNNKWLINLLFCNITH
ncbi:hypothetical protein [Aliarcobacter butzleri]|uniref:hypothetical protein n=1 Tax=Aliarcobacter butzleri TaxID=28197 RepID=UPI00263D1A2C|nr:hypothetical protein [Aliarcobacter butzleri]MDN5060006.1 hypothetical protein [Aliarcobacter butzleri]